MIDRSSSGPPPVTSFSGTHRFLSNFYPAIVHLDGEDYATVEHAYQAAKTLNSRQRRMIRLATTPVDARRLGRRLTFRHDWYGVRVEVMLGLVRQKFSSAHPRLHSLLLATGDRELVEGNMWGDTFWGKCRGVGQNHLGKILMQVRQEIFIIERAHEEAKNILLHDRGPCACGKITPMQCAFSSFSTHEQCTPQGLVTIRCCALGACLKCGHVEKLTSRVVFDLGTFLSLR